jgi:hypothetical protein
MEWQKSVMRNAPGMLESRTPAQIEADRLANWATGAGFTPQEIRERGGLLGMGATPGTYDQSMMMASIAPMNLIAYHGSPHKFDKFSMEKIGTGEGAQAYGHGLYFAENPATAGTYARMGMTQANPGDKARALLAARWQEVDDLAKKAAQAPDNPAWSERLARVTKEAEALGPRPANLYKVDIPDEAVSKMLDWDKPLSQQPELLKKAREFVGDNPEVLDALPRLTGEQFHNRILPMIGVGRGGPGGPDQSFTAAWLKERGIPGIKYLDAGSRAAGEGSRNFVLFDENLARIIERK